MQLHEFSEQWNNATSEVGFNPQAPVMVSVPGQPPLTVKKVHTEFHEDMNTHTVWIEAEE